MRHGLRNAAVPVTAYLGVQALFLVEGALVVAERLRQRVRLGRACGLRPGGQHRGEIELVGHVSVIFSDALRIGLRVIVSASNIKYQHVI